MPLPYEPESEESALDRFPKAIIKQWRISEQVQAAITKNKAGIPSLVRTHVFDFYDGTRMIANLDMMDFPGAPRSTFLHFSFSVLPEGKGTIDPATWPSRVEKLLELFTRGRPLIRKELSPLSGMPNYFYAA